MNIFLFTQVLYTHKLRYRQICWYYIIDVLISHDLIIDLFTIPHWTMLCFCTGPMMPTNKMLFDNKTSLAKFMLFWALFFFIGSSLDWGQKFHEYLFFRETEYWLKGNMLKQEFSKHSMYDYLFKYQLKF